MHLTLRQKLSIIIATAGLAFFISTTAGMYLDAQAERQVEAIRDHYIPLVEMSYRLHAAFEGINTGLRDAVASQDANAVNSVRELNESLHNDLEGASNIVGPQEVEACIRAIDDYFNFATDTSLRLIGGETGLSIVDAMKKMQELRAGAEGLLRRVAYFDRDKLTEAFALIDSTRMRAEQARFIVNVACTLLILFIAVLIVRGVVASLKKVEEGLGRFGEGNFAHPIPVVGNDEFAELAKKVNSMAERIQALLKEIESFSYSVAHDLRAPIRSINGFGAALMEDEGPRLSEGGKASLARIIAAAKRMGEMVDGLLSLSRLNRTEIKKQTVDLSKMAIRIVDELKRSDPDRKFEFAAAPAAEANGDSRLLDVVLTNLLSNAWKFTRKRDVAQIEFGKITKDGQPTFFVRDNGAGFDMQYADKLFGTFQRLHAPTEFEGHGIGLATVRSVINRHGGKIWAESEIDKGTTFYFTVT